MKILLVYEVIPEDTKLYIFENVNPNSELCKNLQIAHGNYGNTLDDGTPEYDAVEFISDYISTNKRDQILMSQLPSAGPFDAVFISGFVL